MIAIHVLETIILYIFLAWVSARLSRLFFLGFFNINFKKEKISSENVDSGHAMQKSMPSDNASNEKEKDKEKTTNMIALSLIGLYLYLTFYLGNIWIFLSASILMLTKLPSLLWEFNNGRKITVEEILHISRKNPVYIICSILDWAVLPFLYYSLWYL